MSIRILKSVVTGVAGSFAAVVLFVFGTLALLWLKVQSRNAAGMGMVAGINGWPLRIAALLGFVVAFMWMWRRSL